MFSITLCAMVLGACGDQIRYTLIQYKKFIKCSLLERKKERRRISGAVVRQRTIPTKQPPLVGEVSANFSG
jgi:hypothetical protein